MTMQTIPARDGGSFQAYVALPAAPQPAPVVIVIQEIFGVNGTMRAKCDELAQDGYIAVCPDLFWRLEPGVELTDKTEAEWAKAFDLLKRFDVDQGVEDLRATLHAYRGHADANGQVGCIGYCLGGKLAYLMAARTQVDCAVGYYGIGLEALLEESSHIKKPLMLHIAQEDKYVTKEAQKKITDVLGKSRMVTLHSYPGVDHAFSRIGGQHYNEAAAETANSRTAGFLRQNLRRAEAA